MAACCSMIRLPCLGISLYRMILVDICLAGRADGWCACRSRRVVALQTAQAWMTLPTWSSSRSC